MGLTFPHWQGQRQNQGKPLRERRPGVIAVGLVLLAPEFGGHFCVSSEHWRWCGLPDFCLSERGEQGSAVCAAGPAVSIAQEKVSLLLSLCQ